MTDNGYNEEEMKMVKETKKIWGTTDVNITATCIRVPIMRAHAESINLEFERDVSEEEVSSEKDGALQLAYNHEGSCRECMYSVGMLLIGDKVENGYGSEVTAHHGVSMHVICRLLTYCPRQRGFPSSMTEATTGFPHP